tara:strand:- start:2291 stop:2878 length:588 start_codon:yes stop_codon:yes gene_type:complete
MKKLNFILTLSIVFFISSCSDNNQEDEFENLNCSFENIVEPINFGITEVEMISQNSISVQSEFTLSGGYNRYDIEYNSGLENLRTFYTRNELKNNDENLTKYYYAHQIIYEPNNFKCVRQWMFEKYGQPDFDNVNPNQQGVRYSWHLSEPDEGGNYPKKINLEFAQYYDTETSSYTPNKADYVRVIYWDVTFFDN